MGEFGNNYKGNKELSTISTYFWNSVANYNEWSESQLNIVNLNQNYVNSIRGKWSDLIATTNWQVGGITKDQSNTPRSVYIYEIEGPIENVIYSAKIGLMYVSDYGYAASPENWNTNMESLDNNTNYNNWMFMGLYEWTISRCSDNMDSAFYVHDRGSVIRTPVDSHVSGIRPAFYLNSDVELASGIGTQIDPYRLSV